MHADRIKIGHQNQADLPIYLSRTGSLICGCFNYSGSQKKHLSELYNAIHELVGPQGKAGLDVSMFKHWDAVNIYHEHIAVPWNKSLSAKQLERLSIETSVYNMLAPVRELFKKSVAKKWKRLSKITGVDDPNRPTQAWQILKPTK